MEVALTHKQPNTRQMMCPSNKKIWSQLFHTALCHQLLKLYIPGCFEKSCKRDALASYCEGAATWPLLPTTQLDCFTALEPASGFWPKKSCAKKQNIFSHDRINICASRACLQGGHTCFLMVFHAILRHISNYCICAISSLELSVCAIFLRFFQLCLISSHTSIVRITDDQVNHFWMANLKKKVESIRALHEPPFTVSTMQLLSFDLEGRNSTRLLSSFA